MYQVMYGSAHEAMIAQRMGTPLDGDMAGLPRPRRRVPNSTEYRRIRNLGGEL